MRFPFIVAALIFFATQTGPSHAQTAIASTTCAVADVAVFENRVHVRCLSFSAGSQIQGQIQGMAGGGSTAGAAPSYFAVGLQPDPNLATLTLSLATQAAAQNKRVHIFYAPNPSANPPGCAANDCRRLVGLVMLVVG